MVSLLYCCALFISLTTSVDITKPDSNVDKTAEAVTSLDKQDDPTELLEKKLEAMNEQIVELQRLVSQQRKEISALNDTLDTFVFTSDQYGVIYDKMDDRPLLLTSLHAHDVPFVMLNVISVRLPKRDSYRDTKKKKQRGGRALSQGKRKGISRRYVHVIVTLSRDGIFQLWDDEQNELHTMFDPSILPQSAESTDDELINSKTNFVVHSDIVSQPKYGNTRLVMARNDAEFVKVYAVTAWRDYVNDKQGARLSKSMMAGQISAENTIYRPTDKQIEASRAKNSKKKKKTKKEKPKKKDDVNEFDNETGESDKTETDKAQCDSEDGTCAATNVVNIVDNFSYESGVTVTGVAMYQLQRKQYIVAAYSDGTIFTYKPNGALASTASSVPWHSPNKTIAFISSTPKKNTMVVITEVGFRFLKLPKLTKTGPFCNLPGPMTVNDVKFDTISNNVMYLGTTDGRLLMYNTRKLSKSMCKQLDDFTVHVGSPLQIDTVPGYVLVTSSIGLHVYNGTKKKSSGQERPALLMVQKFEEEFEGNNGGALDGHNVLVSSHTDAQERTVIAYVQSASSTVDVDSKEPGTDVKYRFVVLESYLPSFNAQADKKGLFGVFSKAPLVVGIALFAFFWIFFKGGGSAAGNKGGPLGLLGKMFGGGNRPRRPSFASRGGANDIVGKAERWQSRHGARATTTPLTGAKSGRPGKSANMRYTSRSNSKSRGGMMGGGDWSD